MFNTLEASLKTKKAVIVSERAYSHKGNDRVAIIARKDGGTKLFHVVRYENGKFSTAA